MTEEAFLRALRFHPGDDTTRLIYADWLEEQGDESSASKAEFLRLDCRLASTQPRARGLAALKRRRRRLAEKLDSAWLAVVGKERIERCNFEFECPLKWENLRPVEGSETTRFCDSCRQTVHFCATLPEARLHAEQGHCIAVDARVPRGADGLVQLYPEIRRTMGKILPWGLHPPPGGQ